MTDIVKRLLKAKGSPTLRSVLLGHKNAEMTCLEAADQIESYQKRDQEIANSLQLVCERLGCSGGMNRFDFLEAFSKEYAAQEEGGDG